MADERELMNSYLLYLFKIIVNTQGEISDASFLLINNPLFANSNVHPKYYRYQFFTNIKNGCVKMLFGDFAPFQKVSHFYNLRDIKLIISYKHIQLFW